ncbi:MAG: PPC domain-containing protein [Planctomycetaceae bacterium]|jgi:hypothetical protein|nr:PPC domain-containing protein [Planctomycetaceae bacterium]
MLRFSVSCVLLLTLATACPSTVVAAANPVITTVTPAGGQLGTSLEVTVTGSGLEGPARLDCTAPGVETEAIDNAKDGRYRITIPTSTPPGLYDLRVAGRNGLSSPRLFQVGNRRELSEVDPNNTLAKPQPVPLNAVLNGRLGEAGDQDCFRFSAKTGQRVVIECWAERIGSLLHPILQLFDAKGRLLKVSRGYFGIDPLIDFPITRDGEYVVRLHDLTYTGGANHIYRLDIDTGPRVAFAVPAVIRQGRKSRLRLYGWNLANRVAAPGLDSVEVEIPAGQARVSWPLPLRLAPSQTPVDGLAWQLPGAHAPVLIGVTDTPVIVGALDNRLPKSAHSLVIPCEVSGQLSEPDERDWFAFDARQGEVIYLEAFGERIGAPVDLAVSVMDSTGRSELFRCRQDPRNLGGLALPTRHADPTGRFVAPADGRFLVVIRNRTSSVHPDPRRIYRLSLQREVPVVDVAVVPTSAGPMGINVERGGRTVLDVVAFRRRGCNGAVRIFAENLPIGVDCPDVFLGPGVSRGQLVLSAANGADPFAGSITLSTSASGTTRRPVRATTVVRGGRPNGWSRLSQQIPLGIAGSAPLRITADGHQTRIHHLYGELKVRHAPGCVLDVAIEVERKDPSHLADVQLIGVGVPASIANQTTTIPAAKTKGHISFYLPAGLPLGRYTLGVKATTTVPTADGKKTESVAVFSNPVVFDVHPPMFHVALDPYNPKTIKRGQIVQIKYSVRRANGFINKIHTELAAPGHVTKVRGLRGRGVTSVGQTETGSIQIIANDDALLGQQPFLRLYAVGVLEDEALFHGSHFLQLKIVE